MDIRFKYALHLHNLAKTVKADLSASLHILRLLNENAIRIAHQSTFKKEQRTVLFESVYDHNIAAVIRVAWLAPFKLFLEAAVEHDLSQLLHLTPPRLQRAKNFIDL